MSSLSGVTSFLYIHCVRFTVKILGSGAAIPSNSRFPSAQLVNLRNQSLLLDCGEGTQMQLKKLATGAQRINHIFISHLHGDHYYGLIGIISSYHLLARQWPLYVHGVPGLKEIIDLQLKHSQTELVYPLEIHETDPAKSRLIVDNKHFSVRTIPLDHRVPTCGFLVKEKPLKRNVRKDFLKEVKVPVEAFVSIQEGKDFTDAEGKTYPNKDITLDPPAPRSYAYCTDTAYNESIIKIIKGVDVLYHEATFGDEKVKVAREKKHATAREAATIAKKAGVGRLIIGHFSARYSNPEKLLEQAREVFPDTIAAEEGMVIEL
jgi:ribonuclease Z